MAVLKGAFIGAFVSLLFRTTDSRPRALGLAVVVAVALIKVIVETVQVDRATVRLSLDASRRWGTLSGVHSNFKATTYQGPESYKHCFSKVSCSIGGAHATLRSPVLVTTR
jgi:hypothetical protein